MHVYIKFLTGRTYNIDHEERIPLFLRTSEKDPSLPYEPLLRYATISFMRTCTEIHGRTLSNTDEFLQMKASQILTVLLR